MKKFQRGELRVAKNQDLVPENHKCFHCGWGKDKAHFAVRFSGEKPYVSKLCNSCNSLSQREGIPRRAMITKQEKRERIAKDVAEYFEENYNENRN